MQLSFILRKILAWRWPTCGLKHISLCSKNLTIKLTNICVDSYCVSVCNTDTKGCLRYFPSCSQKICYNCERLYIIWTKGKYTNIKYWKISIKTNDTTKTNTEYYTCFLQYQRKVLLRHSRNTVKRIGHVEVSAWLNMVTTAHNWVCLPNTHVM